MSGSPNEQFSSQPMTPMSPPADQPIDDEAYCYALEWLAKGSRPSDVRRNLIDSGHSPTQADRIVQKALQFKRDHESMQAVNIDNGNSAKRNMVIGGLICLAGIAITLGTMASASGGGQVIIAWGAIVFGGIQFFRGFMQNHQG
jgi:hypothetical protein